MTTAAENYAILRSVAVTPRSELFALCSIAYSRWMGGAALGGMVSASSMSVIVVAREEYPGYAMGHGASSVKQVVTYLGC